MVADSPALPQGDRQAVVPTRRRCLTRIGGISGVIRTIVVEIMLLSEFCPLSQRTGLLQDNF